jgi:hypothetical protein
MCFHSSGMATPSVDLVRGAASNFVGSAVSRAYEACHTRHAPTCLTSDKARYGALSVISRATGQAKTVRVAGGVLAERATAAGG